MRIKVFKRRRIEIREEDLVFFVRMEVKKVFWRKKQFLRRIERFHDMASDFLTGIVLTIYGWAYIKNVTKGLGDKKIFINKEIAMIKMCLSENRGLTAIGKKFTSPPFIMVANEWKIERIEDVTLMFTAAYDV